jgi:hypothetical protein
MANIKHVGRLKGNKRKVIVPYRTIPGDAYSCLVVFTDSLSSDEHDSLIRVVESSAGQEAYELAEAMSRAYLPDGRNMLIGFHKTGRLHKLATADVEMVPNINSIVGLDELNQLIADHRGVSIEDLAILSNTTQVETAAEVREVTPLATANVESQITDAVTLPLSDEDLARKYRGDADRLSKEAANLRRMAEELVPTKKKTTRLTA